MRNLLVFLVCVSLVAVLELTTASRPAAAADPGCYVNVDASFGASATTGSRAVDVIVLPGCIAVVGQARALTPLEVASLGPQPASIQQRCSWANRMIGAGGEGDAQPDVRVRLRQRRERELQWDDLQSLVDRLGRDQLLDPEHVVGPDADL